MSKTETKSVNSAGRRTYRIAWTAGLFAVVLAVVVGFTVSGRSGDKASTVTKKKQAGPAGIITVPAEQRASIHTDLVTTADLPVQTTAPGKVDFNANRVTPLFAQFAGRVVRLDAEVGMSVRQGQVLGMLDSPDVVGIQCDYQRAQADHQQAVAAERTARSSLDLTVRTRERSARLAEVEAIPQRELQEAQVAEAHAKDELQRAQSADTAAQSAVAAARGKLQIAGFSDQDIERLDNGGPSAITRMVPLTAPVNGSIVERSVGLGQVVQVGGEALFKIADLSTVWVNAEVYEDQLASVRPGAEVMIRTSAYPNETFTARVDRIAATVDSEKRTVAVRCIVPNGDGRLKPGMFATVVLHSGTIQRAVVVPTSALGGTSDRRTAFVEKEPGTYQERVIQIGDEIAGSVVVRSGLREGERVVTQGGLLLSRQIEQGGAQ